MAPTLAKVPPAGPEWLHEVKFDGWRMQAHVEGDEVALYSKNGTDYTRRFRALKSSLVNVRAKDAVIDCELVACDDTGMPSFRTLMEMGNKAPALCLWCFDLLVLDGVRLMPMPLVQRKAILADLISATDDEHLQFSGDFDDPVKLLETCQRMNLEGIVSKRKESAYRPGPTREWLKIKTAAWKAENRGRYELFANQ